MELRIVDARGSKLFQPSPPRHSPGTAVYYRESKNEPWTTGWIHHSRIVFRICFSGLSLALTLFIMGKRREARERAVQFLFQHDLNPPQDVDEALNQFWDSQRAAALAEEKGPAHWNEPVNIPPASTEEAAVRLFADPLIK